jgi:hypothetical protein
MGLSEQSEVPVLSPVAAPQQGTWRAQLTESRWLRRRLHVTTPAGAFDVEYNGAGLGYESVLVDGRTVAKIGSKGKMVPRFDFEVGPYKTIVQIRVPGWGQYFPFFRLRAFSLEVDGRVLYSEGERITRTPEPISYARCPKCSATDAQQVGFTWWGSLLGATLLNHVQCQSCGTQYNGKTGSSNDAAIAIYTAVSVVVGFAVGLLCYFLLL